MPTLTLSDNFRDQYNIHIYVDDFKQEFVFESSELYSEVDYSNRVYVNICSGVLNSVGYKMKPAPKIPDEPIGKIIKENGKEIMEVKNENI